MADKSDSERDEQVISGDTDERVRGVASEEDAEFDDNEDLDEEEDEEEGTTF